MTYIQTEGGDTSPLVCSFAHIPINQCQTAALCLLLSLAPNLLQGSSNPEVQMPHILSSTISAGCCLTCRSLSARPSVDLAPCLAGASPDCPGILSHAELLGWWWLSPLWEAIVSESHSDSRHAKLLPGPAWGLIVFSRRTDLLARCRYQLCNFHKGNTNGLLG